MNDLVKRACINNPQTWTTVWELGVEWAEKTKGKNWDSYNRITIKRNLKIIIV